LALPASELKLGPMVMQLHHKKEVDLRQKGSPNQDSA